MDKVIDKIIITLVCTLLLFKKQLMEKTIRDVEFIPVIRSI